MSQKTLSRRQFISTTAGGLALIGAAGAQAATSPVSATDKATGAGTLIPGPLGRKTRYAIVGLGKFGVGQILPAFTQTSNSIVTALVSGDAEKAKAIAAHYGVPARNIYNYKNYDQLKDNQDVDAVYIILPNALHAEFTVRAAQAGKHVLCEKPLATSVEDCAKMINACKAARVKLMTAYRCRYDNLNRTMIDWSRQQKYGALDFIMADTIMDVGGEKQWRLDPALSGGGSLVDIGIYSLNATRYLTGEEPTEINALSHSNPKDSRFRQIEESIAFQLRFPSGTLANCTSSYGTCQLSRYRVVGPHGWYGMEPATLYKGRAIYHGHGETLEHLALQENNHMAAMVEHFSDCVQNDKAPLTPGEEGMQDVKLMQMIYAAARSRETVRADA